MESLDDLVHLLASREPDDLRHAYLAVPSTVPRLAGTTATALGPLEMRLSSSSGIAIPVSVSDSAPIDFVGVYVTIDQYFATGETGEYPLEAIVRALAHRLSQATSLVNLALVNALILDEERTRNLEAGFLEMLRPDVRARLENVLAGRNEPGRHQLVARQPLLAAMRYTLLDDDGPSEDSDMPTLLGAVLLSHAVGATLGSGEEEGEGEGEELVGVPRSLFFEILRLGLLYQTDDMWSSIDRIVRLWRTYGQKIERTQLRSPPSDLLREATGLDLVEILGLGFAVYAHASQWEPGKPAFLDVDLGSDMEPAKLTAFRRLVSASIEELKDRFAGRSGSAFDFLPFQERPVLEADPGLLVLDPGYLWDRVTSGLYWMVHDAEKARSEGDRHLWTQAFAEAVELMCEDSIQALAPTVLGGGTAFYTEDDFGAAYGGKRCDAVIDFGGVFLLVEVVSGQLSVPTRIEGDERSFVADTERLVLKKCRQLQEAATAVLADGGKALTGYAAIGSTTVLPLLVVGGGYPINPFTVPYIEQRLGEADLLSHPRISALCIIDLAELEMLEGLAEEGPDPITVLRGWKESGIAAVSLRNFVLKEFDGGRHLRPARMKAAVDQTLAEVLGALRLRVPGTA